MQADKKIFEKLNKIIQFYPMNISKCFFNSSFIYLFIYVSIYLSIYSLVHLFIISFTYSLLPASCLTTCPKSPCSVGVYHSFLSGFTCLLLVSIAVAAVSTRFYPFTSRFYLFLLVYQSFHVFVLTTIRFLQTLSSNLLAHRLKQGI